MFLALLAAVPVGTAAGQVAAPVLRLEESMDSMGTTWSLAVYGSDRFKLQAAVEEAFEEVRRLDRMLSNYRGDSELTLVNRQAGKAPVRVSKELFELLAACMRYSEVSEGAFDITVGPLMKVWGFYKGTGRFPHRAEIRGALANVGYRNIVLDASRQTVQFRRPAVEIDPGGIGKGYAVDRMVAILRENGIVSGLITAGSSSIYGIGVPPSEPKGWRVVIKHPKDPTQSVQELFLKDTSMSTSGNYEKFFRAGRKIYSHIMDPRTGYPAPGMLTVSVVSSKTLDSEAWTKPYFINGRNWASNHKLPGSRVFLCEDRSELACAWLQ
ncbi:MAG TPA: FAD:protein FMN transferase [Bryobacteraceae bacterium]|nr:FAD:protein FMN transferase [Bryobacteraceae bacterium]